MRSSILLAVALAAMPVWPAFAINKCLNAEGDRIIYSDAPCMAETQPMNAQENTIHLVPADRTRRQAEQAQSRERELEQQRRHEAQQTEALRIRDLSRTQENNLAARNGGVQSIIERTPTVSNPTVTGPGPIVPTNIPTTTIEPTR